MERSASPLLSPRKANPLLSPRSRYWRSVFKNWQLYLFLVPATAFFIIFCYMPMYGILMAFKEFSLKLGVTASPWAKPLFKYFTQYFSSRMANVTIINTITISFYSLIAGFPFPIILALMLNEVKNVRYKKLVQNVTYAPYFISVIVLVGMINLFFSQTGVVNALLGKIGIKPTDWLTQSNDFIHLYVWTGVWQHVGFNSIIYFAALAGVSPELHEAAIIDGASRMKRMWHINLPHIRPTIVILLIMSAGGIMNVGFQKIYLMQTAINRDVSEVISTYTYQLGIHQLNFSMGSAIGLFNNVINLVMLLLVNWVAGKLSDSSLF